MVQIRQLAKTTDLQKGNQLLVGQSGAANQYPRKSSIWLLIQYLSTGVFEYLSIRDWFKVPGVPFADLPDPEEAGLGARAFCTDADRVPDSLLTVGSSGTIVGYGNADAPGYFGSMTNTIFSPNGGEIIGLVWDDATSDTFSLAFEAEYPDSGWNTIVVNGTTFARADANFFNGPDFTLWAWPSEPNPFSAEGEVDEIYFGTTGIEFNDPIGGGGSKNIPVFSDGNIWRAG